MTILLIMISFFIKSKDFNYYKYDENIYLAVLVNGEEQNDFPSKGNYEVNVSCDNDSVKWDYDNWKLKLSNITSKIKCAVSFKSANPINLASYIISLASDSTNTGVYNEKGYRYEGKNPNNWIMFNGEYWRIIGVFDESTHGKTGEMLVKLIREDSIGGIAWHKSNTNDWTTASLKNLLNENYYNGTKEETITNCYAYSTTVPGNCNLEKDGLTNDVYRSMIENVTWKLGGHSTNGATTEIFYNAERGTTVYSGRPTSYEGKVGLMYPSDYGYSVLASDCVRATNLSSYNNVNCGGKSWLSGKGYEWTLTPNSSNSSIVFYVSSSAYLSFTNANNGYATRPSIYLKSDILKLMGNGSYETPYIIIE